MKKAIEIVLALVIIGLGYWATDMILSPLRFQSQTKARQAVVIDRIKDIRAAERAFKQKNQRYTSSFDTLINFVLHDSLVFEKKIGSADDSLAVARGLVRTEKFKMAIIDTVFGAKKLTPDQVKELRYIPYAPDGKEFYLDAGLFTTESKVIVPVFECKAPYKDFLWDLNHQELVNLIDETKNIYEKYPGIKVGAMDAATNDAGNWE